MQVITMYQQKMELILTKCLKIQPIGFIKIEKINNLQIKEAEEIRDLNWDKIKEEKRKNKRKNVVDFFNLFINCIVFIILVLFLNKLLIVFILNDNK